MRLGERAAIATVSARGEGERAVRVLHFDGSYLSAQDKRLHFGLGSAGSAKVEIAWPSGTRQTLNDVRADQFLEVREPEKP